MTRVAVPSGLYRNVPGRTYARWDAFSYSRLKRLDMERTCPARVQHEMTHPKDPSAEMILGQLTEWVLGLERGEWAEPEKCAATLKSGKPCAQMGTGRWVGHWFCTRHKERGEADPIRIATDEQRTKAGAMARAVIEHDEASQLLGPPLAVFQPSAIASVDGWLPAKARPDGMRPGIVWDLKTARSAHPTAFGWAAWEFRYHIQAAMTLDVLSELDRLAGREPMERSYWWVVVENTAPHCVAVYRATDDVIEDGRARYMRAALRYRECSDGDEWPGYPGASDIDWPRRRLLTVPEIMPAELPVFIED